MSKQQEWYAAVMNGGYSAFNQLVSTYSNDPDFEYFLQTLQSKHPQFFDQLWNNYVTSSVADGSLGLNDAYGSFGQTGAAATEETTKYLDNAIAQQNTAQDRAYQTEMRDTSLTSAASQLSSLGLSPSNVIQVGGASSGVSSEAAGQNLSQGGANRRQQLYINQYNQRMSMAKSLISMAGSMASSGIYGASLNAAKHSAAVMGSATAHSGLMALKTLSGKSYADVLNGLNNK